MFKLDNLQVKACDEFIIDPLSCILQEQKLSNIGGAARIRKIQIIKAIPKHLEKNLYMTCLKFEFSLQVQWC
jgi:hypothetical protein